MKIVVDTNILFSFFNELSLTRSLILNPDFTLISPEKSLEELNKYSSDICKKVKNLDFKKTLELLKKVIKFIPNKELSNYISQAEKFSQDKEDADFFALCLKENCILWSNDDLLKEQDKIKVLSTQDMIDILF